MKYLDYFKSENVLVSILFTTIIVLLALILILGTISLISFLVIAVKNYDPETQDIEDQDDISNDTLITVTCTSTICGTIILIPLLFILIIYFIVDRYKAFQQLDPNRSNYARLPSKRKSGITRNMTLSERRTMQESVTLKKKHEKIFSIVSIVIGLFCIVINIIQIAVSTICGIFGLVLGLIALSYGVKGLLSNGTKSSMFLSRSIVGVVIGSIGIVISLFVLLIMFLAFH